VFIKYLDSVAAREASPPNVDNPSH
jgi:hypothetical protein